MTTNSIGPHTFLQLTGPFPGLTRDIEVEARSGVEGVALWNTAKRGKPFQVETFVDIPGGAAAATTYLRAYETLIGNGPHSATWAGAPAGVQVEVLAVQAVEAVQLVAALGGINNGNATLRCRWMLIAVAD